VLAAFCACAGAQGQDSPTPTTAPPAAPASPGATAAGAINDSAASAQADSSKPLRVGGNVQGSKITHMVEPVYPPIAKTAHISGTVVLHAIIEKDGTVGELTYISGPPLLMKAAIDAVKQWTYAPTFLNGKAVRVDTVVSIVFTLGNGSGDTSPAAPENASNGPSGAPEVKIDPAFRVSIVHLLELTHFSEREREAAQTMFASIRPQLLKSMPLTPNRDKIVDTYQSKLADLMSSDAFTNPVIAIYAQYLTLADVKAATAFYETPEGQHYLDSSQKMLQDVFQLGKRVALENIPTILTDLCKQYPELQGEAKFCPASTSSPKSELRLHVPAAPSGN